MFQTSCTSPVNMHLNNPSMSIYHPPRTEQRTSVLCIVQRLRGLPGPGGPCTRISATKYGYSRTAAHYTTFCDCSPVSPSPPYRDMAHFSYRLEFICTQMLHSHTVGYVRRSILPPNGIFGTAGPEQARVSLLVGAESTSVRRRELRSMSEINGKSQKTAGRTDH